MALQDVGARLVLENLTGFTSGMGQAQQSTNQLSQNLQQSATQSEGLNTRMLTLSVTAGVLLAGALQRVGSVISDGIGTTIGFSDQLQQASIAFNTMTGSAEVGQKTLAELKDFALKTPFDFPDVLEGAKRLMAMGVSAEDLTSTMDILGNISAGVGRDKLPFLVLAFGQVQTIGHLAGQELRQFAEAGVPLLATLAQQGGVSLAEMQAKVEAGAVSFADVRAALASTTAEGGKFFNLMEQQSHTFGGAMSNVRDAARFAAAEGFRPLFDAMTDAANAAANFLMTADFKAWAQTTGGVLGPVVTSVREFVASGYAAAAAIGAIGGAALIATPAIQALAISLTAAAIAAAPLVLAIAAGVAVGVGAKVAYDGIAASAHSVALEHLEAARAANEEHDREVLLGIAHTEGQRALDAYRNSASYAAAATVEISDASRAAQSAVLDQSGGMQQLRQSNLNAVTAINQTSAALSDQQQGMQRARDAALDFSTAQATASSATHQLTAMIDNQTSGLTQLRQAHLNAAAAAREDANAQAGAAGAASAAGSVLDAAFAVNQLHQQAASLAASGDIQGAFDLLQKSGEKSADAANHAVAAWQSATDANQKAAASVASHSAALSNQAAKHEAAAAAAKENAEALFRLDDQIQALHDDTKSLVEGGDLLGAAHAYEAIGLSATQAVSQVKALQQEIKQDAKDATQALKDQQKAAEDVRKATEDMATAWLGAQERVRAATQAAQDYAATQHQLADEQDQLKALGFSDEQMARVRQFQSAGLGFWEAVHKEIAAVGDEYVKQGMAADAIAAKQAADGAAYLALQRQQTEELEKQHAKQLEQLAVQAQMAELQGRITHDIAASIAKGVASAQAQKTDAERQQQARQIVAAGGGLYGLTLDQLQALAAVNQTSAGFTFDPTMIRSLIEQLGGTPAFAGGVRGFRGGMAVVGEQGPELAYLAQGTSILPNNLYQQLAGLGDSAQALARAVVTLPLGAATAPAPKGRQGMSVTVNANYSNPQEPQSIALDLQSIVMLAGV